jgi:hypothetical protein
MNKRLSETEIRILQPWPGHNNVYDAPSPVKNNVIIL